MTTNVRALIVDDELYSRQELAHLLRRFDRFELIGEADNGGKALELIVRKEPDVVFLDIELPDMTGIELAEALTKLKCSPLLVFATAFPDYALPAFRYEAIDYLLKPFDEEQLQQTVQRIVRHVSDSDSDRAASVEAPPLKSANAKLAVEEEDKIVYVSPADIVYICSEDGYTRVCTRVQTYQTKATLKQLESKLKDLPFVRIHKSFIVNAGNVVEMTPWFHGAYQVRVDGRPESIPVSRNFVKRLRDRLEL